MPNLTVNARNLRRNQTEAESVLWYHLRNRRLLGLKFHRQYAIEPYIVDFICHTKKLIIEVDGGQHASEQEEDSKRTVYLEAKGFKVVRFWNNEVLVQKEGVLERLYQLLT